MRDSIYNDEFENFLQDQVNKHRVYPSNHIWRNIQEDLHGYGRWPALTAITIFVITALVVGTILVKPHIPGMLVASNTISSPKVFVERETVNKKSSEILVEHLSVTHITQQTVDAITENQENKYQEAIVIPVIPENLISIANSSDISIAPTISIVDNNKVANTKGVELIDRFANFHPNIKGKSKPLFPILPYDLLSKTSSTEKNNFSTNVVDLNLSANEIRGAHQNAARSIKLNKSILTKLDFQFYLTPSLSYRKLWDNADGKLSNSYITALPFASNYVVDVNHKEISHKPAIGYEVGFQLGYKLTNKFSLRAGFQFNMQQYNIDAYVFGQESSPITTDGDVPVTIASITNSFANYRNVPASTPFTIKNRYYEISMPIGVDWRPVGKGKITWGVAASIQPTYTFDKQPFIITTDYKTYSDGSKLMRNWNVNANGETYVAYQAGKFRWQAGPQVRYQLLPTLSNKYPIKENLVDFGFKIGFVKSLK